jgi:carboxylesterase type B
MARLFALFLYLAVASAVQPLVNLGYTQYQGTPIPAGITQWLGMRYAAPPVGNLRFKGPEDPPFNTTIQDASNHGLICIPTASTYNSNKTSEDCLFVDVYAPSDASSWSRLPVYVFIQGGGFNSNANPNFNGTGLILASDMNIVVVTFNYRVGPYGFLASQQVQKDGNANAGLLDQRKLFEWVQKYIRNVRR